MLQFDRIDWVLIALAVMALVGHFAYSRWKKVREEDERRRLDKLQPQVWADVSSDDEDK